jgi:hypothetical protein
VPHHLDQHKLSDGCREICVRHSGEREYPREDSESKCG